ncbi:hypothetical protein IE81DRAFT_154711 [Ceraceosorus guamensis]|uniref:Uncharacterized protein n=1 Tax=Ceraceosorus guamensis TaxID=1522189 RepID=A0A316VZU1_9BASI|nr:hypothetical protein IE81DRAFT_154711 [Ceraceosorus guamensis]PWN41801.1 hypothetical protein IE81DRAFT_154711 [Ceraceosorus guamensis]
MLRFVWTAHQRDGEFPVYTTSWPDSHTSTGQENFEQMAQDATFDSPHVALMCNRLDQRSLLRATPPSGSHTVEDLDASCIEHYRERLRFASRISTTTSGFPREVQGDHLSGICCSPLNLVDSAAKRMGAGIDDCHGVWTFEQTRGESRFDKIGLRTWTNESALCGLLASMLSVASNAFNALPVGAGEASGPSNASSARRHVVWAGEDLTDLPPSPAFAKEVIRTRADAKWDFALFSYSMVEGNATDCQDVRIIAIMEVKRYISLETLAGIVALGSGGSKPPEVLGGSKASASARLLAQLVEYCMSTGARTGVIFSGAYLQVVDMDGTNKPRITVRTPSVAPACGPILETPSRSGNDLKTRYNLPCTLLALMTHALERAERLGQRPILQKHALDENSDEFYKHVESSGSSQDRPSSRQLRSHTRRVRSRPAPRGSAQGLLDEAKFRPDVELRGLPIGGGACARVYRAYVLSGQIMPTSSGTTLLAKV